MKGEVISKITKESSDEFNPPVTLRRKRWWRVPKNWEKRDYLAMALASCGVGYAPVMPGTFGSAVGVGVYLLALQQDVSWTAWMQARGWTPPVLYSLRVTIVTGFLVALFLVGVWAASRAEKLLDRKDPGLVVIDEVIGQLITFLVLPPGASWWAIGAGFFLFRLFDIWKPYPVRRLEDLEGGLGIIADDVMAGFYAALVLSFLYTTTLLFS